VLKKKKFPEVEFMTAMVPRSSSTTQRAIIVGREALTCGLIKLIGSRTHVDVCADRWIPGTRTTIPSVRVVVEG
jgi:ribosomal protein S2